MSNTDIKLFRQIWAAAKTYAGDTISLNGETSCATPDGIKLILNVKSADLSIDAGYTATHIIHSRTHGVYATMHATYDVDGNFLSGGIALTQGDSKALLNMAERVQETARAHRFAQINAEIARHMREIGVLADEANALLDDAPSAKTPATKAPSA